MKTGKTFVAKPQEQEPKWFMIDATDKILGRLAQDIAGRLRGKNKPIFTPNVDCGDYIVVINAAKIKVTGNKETDKKYYKHTGYIGNMKVASVAEIRAKYPERLIENAVKGMLPKGPLGRAVMKKLKVYPTDIHPHEAQNPQTI